MDTTVVVPIRNEADNLAQGACAMAGLPVVPDAVSPAARKSA